MRVQRAQYKLTDIKDFIIQGKYIITKKAKETSENDFEFSEEDVLDAILNLTMANFDHSMTTRHNHKLWQDVYKTKVGNKKAYIKVQINNDCGIIISFKEDQS